MEIRVVTERAPANDVRLIQLVRGSLGREGLSAAASRINISSCGSVVTLHGVVGDRGERGRVENAVKEVPGVAGTVNKLRIV